MFNPSRFPVRCLLLLVAVLVGGNAFSADMLQMKNGDVIRGEILEQRIDQYVQIQTKDGNERRVKWSDIGAIKKEQDSGSSASRGLLIAGGVTLGVSYLATVVVTATQPNPYASTFVPVIGPFITALQPNQASIWPVLEVISGSLQLAGAGLLVAGLVTSVSDHTPAKTVSIAPIMAPNTAGATLAFRF